METYFALLIFLDFRTVWKRDFKNHAMFFKCKSQNSTSKTGRCHLFGVVGILESGSPLKSPEIWYSFLIYFLFIGNGTPKFSWKTLILSMALARLRKCDCKIFLCSWENVSTIPICLTGPSPDHPTPLMNTLLTIAEKCEFWTNFFQNWKKMVSFNFWKYITTMNYLAIPTYGVGG